MVYTPQCLNVFVMTSHPSSSPWILGHKGTEMESQVEMPESDKDAYLQIACYLR